MFVVDVCARDVDNGDDALRRTLDSQPPEAGRGNWMLWDPPEGLRAKESG